MALKPRVCSLAVLVLMAGCAGIGSEPPVVAFTISGEWAGVYSCQQLGEIGDISLTIGGGSLSGSFQDFYSGKVGTMAGDMVGLELRSGTFTFDGEEPRTIAGSFARQGENPHLALGQFTMTMPDGSRLFLGVWIQRRL